MADHDRVDPADAELAAVSAALDGEGPMPEGRSESAIRFAEAATAVRRAVRLTEAEPVPDLRDAVLRQLDGARPTASPWRRVGAVAAAFVIGVAVAAAFLLDRDLDSTELAASELRVQILAAQTTITALDADVAVTERGVHPDVDVRQYRGTLQYRAPEQLSLVLSDVSKLPAGWPANDLEIVVDEDVAWRTRRLSCPVDNLPGCLGPSSVSGIANRPPFSAGWAAPLDLVVPVGAVAGESGDVRVDGELVIVDTTVARARDLVATTLDNGAFRQVHADDRMEIRLDSGTLTLRGFSVTAVDTTARSLWATTWGYDDAVGSEIFRLDLTPRDDTADFSAPRPTDDLTDARFRDESIDGSILEVSVPEGFTVHRRGTIRFPGVPPVTVTSWANGRAWILLHRTRSSSPAAPVGAETVTIDGSVLHVDRLAREVLVFAEDQRITVAGSAPLDDLIALAGSLPDRGIESSDQSSGRTFTVQAGGEIISVATRPALLLPPPETGDVVGVTLRGTIARHSPTLGTLTWLENGTLVVLSSTADLEVLLFVGRDLVLP